MTGRPQDAIWQHFDKIKTDNKLLRARCKKCKKEMCSVVSRMKIHVYKCNINNNESGDSGEMNDEDVKENNPPNNDDDIEAVSEYPETNIEFSFQNKRSKMVHLSRTTDSTPSCSSSTISATSTSLESFVVRTTNSEKKNIDLQIAKFIYSTNSSFRLAEHKEFKNMINILRPGYKAPNRHQIANELLDDVYITVKQSIEKNLKGKTVCMAMDGWSNIHIEPLICISVTDTSEENIYLIETVDTVENRHTSDYLLKLAIAAIKNCQQFGCIVKSFVTDNASNMAKMRTQLSQSDEIGMPDVITYGCSAHILHLLAKDIDIPEFKENVKKIIKYFKYTHYPSSKFRQEGGTALTLPLDVCWNTLCNCFESYLKNWHILVKICMENRAAIDTGICALIENLDLKTYIQNYVIKLRKIAVALDKMQKETCIISEATEIWLDLLQNIEDGTYTQSEIQSFKNRFNMAMTPPHYLANLLDHRFRGRKLSQEQLEEALEYAAAYHPQVMPFIVKYQSTSSPFREYLFCSQNVDNVNPLSWWRALQSSINNAMFELTMQLHTAVASSAGIERLFSTFGLVHSKLRNKLGTEKAAKLVTIMRAFNSKSSIVQETNDI